MELSTASYNALRPLGKSVLNISAGINGNGFTITRETALRVPYLAHSIVEDIEYHMHLLAAGIKVDFLDHVWVKARMPVGGRGATVQRVRWERGRILTIREYAPKLWRSLLSGQRRAIDGLIDVLMPPVSLVFLAVFLAAVLGTGVQQGLGVAGLPDPGRTLPAGGLALWQLALVFAVDGLRAVVCRLESLGGFVVIADRAKYWMRTDRHAHKKADSEDWSLTHGQGFRWVAFTSGIKGRC